MDASQEQTDRRISVAFLEPACRRFPQLSQAPSSRLPAENLLIDKAQLLTLTAPEMTVLIGGLARPQRQRRPIPKTASSPGNGRSTLTNDFFVNLLDMGDRMETRSQTMPIYLKAATAATGAIKWTGTRVDLVFGSDSPCCCALWLRSTPARTARRNSSKISWRPGQR